VAEKTLRSHEIPWSQDGLCVLCGSLRSLRNFLLPFGCGSAALGTWRNGIEESSAKTVAEEVSECLIGAASNLIMIHDMHPHVQRALADINSSEKERVERGFWFLAEVIERNVVTGDVACSSAAKEVHLDDASRREIQEAILAWIRQHPAHQCAGTAFFALGKFFDKQLAPVFREWLTYYVKAIEANLWPVGQILVGLSNMGESVFPDGSFSAIAHGKILDDAQAYLRKQ